MRSRNNKVDWESFTRMKDIYVKSSIFGMKEENKASINIYSSQNKNALRQEISILQIPVKYEKKNISHTQNSLLSSTFLEKLNLDRAKILNNYFQSLKTQKEIYRYGSLSERNKLHRRLTNSQSSFFNFPIQQIPITFEKNNLQHKKSGSMCKERNNTCNNLYKRKNNIFSIKKDKKQYYYNNIIQLEDLILLEERLNDIIGGIFQSNNSGEFDGGICKECFSWWTFYFSSSLIEKYKLFFWENSNRLIIHSANNLELLVILLTYDISSNIHLLNAFRVILKSLFILIKANFLLIINQILFHIKKNNENTIFIQMLEDILKSNEITEAKTEDNIIKMLNTNCNRIVEYIKIIILQYQNTQNPISIQLTKVFNNISKISNDSLKEFFHENILNRNITRNSVISKDSREKYSQINPISFTYINSPLMKRFCLILDLDETIISFKLKTKNDKTGTLYLRPGLIKFLSALKPYYEIVSFTDTTREYAQPIIDSIESKEKYFEHKFFREHCVIIDKDYVKNISNFGRNLSKIAIVDNNAMNFRLNKENGILIYPFYYYEKKDNALNELKNILLKIGKDALISDIRKGLIKYKREIDLKVSSNMNCI